eukprot:TRINITY_DN10355_c0_g1_i1.p1 TRINITY_DN10355_c0_g1~~TRINITY_DN10355_c0_g1_i1.p1  ORF type:complete len:236 (-),score=62.97 TRINITY_DN10355_c0_g1_i1:84-731(-)
MGERACAKCIAGKGVLGGSGEHTFARLVPFYFLTGTMGFGKGTKGVRNDAFAMPEAGKSWGGKGWGGKGGWGGSSWTPTWSGKGGKGGWGGGKGGWGGGKGNMMRDHPAELKVWLGGLPETCDKKQLQEHMNQAGTCKLVHCTSKGSGGAVFSTAEEVQNAITMLNGSSFNGATIQVDVWTKWEKTDGKAEEAAEAPPEAAAAPTEAAAPPAASE